MIIQCQASWWFQPLWKILVKMGTFPKIGVKIKKHIKIFETTTQQALSNIILTFLCASLQNSVLITLDLVWSCFHQLKASIPVVESFLHLDARQASNQIYINSAWQNRRSLPATGHFVFFLMGQGPYGSKNRATDLGPSLPIGSMYGLRYIYLHLVDFL